MIDLPIYFNQLAIFIGIIILVMFRDDNEEFMKSFGAEDPELLVIPNPPTLSLTDFKIQRQKKLSKYIENSSFNMVSEQS